MVIFCRVRPIEGRYRTDTHPFSLQWIIQVWSSNTCDEMRHEVRPVIWHVLVIVKATRSPRFGSFCISFVWNVKDLFSQISTKQSGTVTFSWKHRRQRSQSCLVLCDLKYDFTSCFCLTTCSLYKVSSLLKVKVRPLSCLPAAGKMKADNPKPAGNNPAYI